MELLKKLDNRYGEDRGIAGIWSNYREDESWWDITRHFHPLLWGLGAEVQRDIGSGSSFPHWLMISLTLGPLSLCARREWPAS